VDYLRDTAIQADIEARPLDISQVGWNGSRFVDMDEKPIDVLFKLYPWEWLVREDFGPAPPRSLDARDRARVEDAAVEQGDPPGALGDVPGHPNLLPRASSRASSPPTT
jgi:hypothetical protein